MPQSNEEQLFPGLHNPDLVHISKLFDDAIAGQASACNIENELQMQGITEKLASLKESLAASKTALLWFQYLDMISIL